MIGIDMIVGKSIYSQSVITSHVGCVRLFAPTQRFNKKTYTKYKNISKRESINYILIAFIKIDIGNVLQQPNPFWLG